MFIYYNKDVKVKNMLITHYKEKRKEKNSAFVYPDVYDTKAYGFLFLHQN